MPKGASPVSAFVPNTAPKARKTPTAKKPKTVAAAPVAAEAQTPAVAPPIPPMPSVVSQPVLVTPEMAAGYLAANKRNRPLRKARVERYARDMAEGRWQMNGETIIISDEGNLLNGQHRLEALVKAAVPVWMMVTTGVPESAFSTMDAGLTRTAGDVLGMKGILNFNQVAAVARICLNYKDGVSISTPRTNLEIEEAIELHAEIEQYVSSHNKIYNLTHSSLVIAICYLAQRFGTETENTVDDFVRGVSTGVNLDEFDARLTYRNKIIAMTADKQRRPEQTVVWYFTQRALTHYLNGNTIAKLVPGRGETPHFSEIPSAPRARVAEMWGKAIEPAQD